VFENIGINLPRTAAEQASAGKMVKEKHVQPGDLVFFTKNKGFGSINHVAIVLETNRHGIQSVIHSTSRGVVIDTNDSGSWKSYWLPRFSKIATFFND
jgi:lipoprotein Spr